MNNINEIISKIQQHLLVLDTPEYKDIDSKYLNVIEQILKQEIEDKIPMLPIRDFILHDAEFDWNSFWMKDMPPE